MAQGKVLGKSGGGLNIQGIIEQYTALGNINAGDFVDYLKNYVSDTSVANTKKDGVNKSDVSIFSVVTLSETKVFIAYTWLYSGNPAHHLYGIVCTISGTIITVGTPTVLVGNSVSTFIKTTNLSLVKIAEDKVCISYNHSDASESIRLIVCTISGTTITIGSPTSISNGVSYMSLVQLAEDKVFVAYSYSSNYYLYGIVCTISGTTITTGTATALYSSSNNKGKYISATLLSEDKVFVCYGSGFETYGIVCTISDTTITKGTHTELYGNGNSIPLYNSSVVALSADKVFIALGVDGSNYYLYGMLCTISGTTITVDTYIPLNILYEAGKYMSLIKLSADEVFIAYGTENSSIYGMTCTISDNNIKIRINKSIGIKDYNVSATLLSADKIFIIHKLIGDDYLYGMIEQLGVFKTTSQNIYGVARTKGTVGDTVPVIVPNIN